MCDNIVNVNSIFFQLKNNPTLSITKKTFFIEPLLTNTSLLLNAEYTIELGI